MQPTMYNWSVARSGNCLTLHGFHADHREYIVTQVLCVESSGGKVIATLRSGLTLELAL